MIPLPQFIDAILLGVVEGVTEFLPVSSTGHLILAADLLQFKDPSNTFEIVIQLGAILAVCVIYFSRLWNVLRGVLRGDKGAWRFAIAVVLAFLPSAFLGVLFHDFIKQVLFSPVVVAISLIVGGIIILVAEKIYKPAATVNAVEDFSPILALKIGIAQCCALIPGVSRSGATIIGALLLGVERKVAAEFSFFLAIPTMMGATVFDLYKNRDVLDASSLNTIAIGFVTSFIVAMLVIRWFVGFVSTHGFTPFAWYRIVFGTVILVWLAATAQIL